MLLLLHATISLLLLTSKRPWQFLKVCRFRRLSPSVQTSIIVLSISVHLQHMVMMLRWVWRTVRHSVQKETRKTLISYGRWFQPQAASTLLRMLMAKHTSSLFRTVLMLKQLWAKEKMLTSWERQVLACSNFGVEIMVSLLRLKPIIKIHSIWMVGMLEMPLGKSSKSNPLKFLSTPQALPLTQPPICRSL